MKHPKLSPERAGRFYDLIMGAVFGKDPDIRRRAGERLREEFRELDLSPQALSALRRGCLRQMTTPHQSDAG